MSYEKVSLYFDWKRALYTYTCNLELTETSSGTFWDMNSVGLLCITDSLSGRRAGGRRRRRRRKGWERQKADGLQYHSRIPSDELDRNTTHSDISVFTKWQKERNVSDVVL
ncbi:hypothetical protein PAMP_014573 [Pampus punctatissimus]